MPESSLLWLSSVPISVSVHVLPDGPSTLWKPFFVGKKKGLVQSMATPRRKPTSPRRNKPSVPMRKPATLKWKHTSPRRDSASQKLQSSHKSPSTTLEPRLNDEFAQWCASNNPDARVCDFEQLARYPGDDRRLWTERVSPGDGHCFYHSILHALRRLGTHPELTRIDGSAPRSTIALRHVTLERLKARSQEYSRGEGTTTTDPRQFRAHKREQMQAIENASSGLQDARDNRGTGHWALDVEIQATSSALGICIALWEGGYWMICFPEPSATDLANPAHCRHVAYIIHVDGVHFNALVPNPPGRRPGYVPQSPVSHID